MTILIKLPIASIQPGLPGPDVQSDTQKCVFIQQEMVYLNAPVKPYTSASQ